MHWRVLNKYFVISEVEIHSSLIRRSKRSAHLQNNWLHIDFSIISKFRIPSICMIGKFKDFFDIYIGTSLKSFNITSYIWNERSRWWSPCTEVVRICFEMCTDVFLLNISLQCLNAILIAFIRVTVYYCQYTKMNGHVVKILKYNILWYYHEIDTNLPESLFLMMFSCTNKNLSEWIFHSSLS